MTTTVLKHCVLCCYLLVSLLLLSLPVIAEEPTDVKEADAKELEALAITSTLDTLGLFVSIRDSLKRDIRQLNKKIKAAQSDTERKTLLQQLDELKADLQTTIANFEDIAADVDLSGLRDEEEQSFSLQQELLALLKPVFDEINTLTEEVRHKTDLKEQIDIYQHKLPILEQALNSTEQLQKKSVNVSVRKALSDSANHWRKEQTFMQSELQAAQLQLNKLLESQESIAEASQSYFKSFVRQRGLYLAVAILVIAAVILLSRMMYLLMQRLLRASNTQQHSLGIRILELLHRLLTVFLVFLGPMIVFYWVEDWVLFSLGLLFIFGIALTLRQALPHYWAQVHLFLNIGAVREGERIVMDGIPWRVERINIYCELVNPVADISQRVPINGLVGLKSRPYASHEPWFPCKKNDWVITADGVYGKVTGISPELVRIVERGGATSTYLTSDFLNQSPSNLATNFRVEETIRVSYSLQKTSTTEIIDTLHYYVLSRIKEEGFGNQLVNLQVEFEKAAESALDIMVIADYKGSLGDRHDRIGRAMQRWCVDACTQYGWEIPYPQMTLHGALPGEGKTL